MAWRSFFILDPVSILNWLLVVFTLFFIVVEAFSSSARTANSQLVPLKTGQNEGVADFPLTLGDIDALACWSLLIGS